MTLALHTRISQSTADGQAPHADAVANQAMKWRRSSSSVGGYKTGSFIILAETLSPRELVSFYDQNIGCRVTEKTYGIVTWEGYILAMQLKQGGKVFEISLDPRYFANKINVRYMDGIGQSEETDWSENTDSSDIFGESGTLISLSGTTPTAATAYRDTMLVEMAWPRSRQVSGDAIEWEAADESVDQLKVIVAGYYSTLNLRYQETTIAAAAASTQIGTLVGNSEFVTAGRVETNSLSVRVDAFPQAKRIGDAIKEVIAQGGSGGAVWQGGVYAGREFVYEAAPTTWEYQMVGNTLLDKAGNPVRLEAVEPGFLLYNPSAPAGWTPPGTSSDWDNPKVAYVEEVELVTGGNTDQLKMRYRNARGGLYAVALGEQIRRGN